MPDVPLMEMLSHLSDRDIASLARTSKVSRARTVRTLRTRKAAYDAAPVDIGAVVETSAIPDFASLRLTANDMAQIIDENDLEYQATPQDLMVLQARGGDYNEFVRGLAASYYAHDERSLPVIHVRFGAAYRSARRQRQRGTPVAAVLAGMRRRYGIGKPCTAGALPHDRAIRHRGPQSPGSRAPRPRVARRWRASQLHGI